MTAGAAAQAASGAIALIDARGEDGGVHAATRVAGIPLVARQVRLAQRAGAQGAYVLVGSDEERRRVEDALRAAPPKGAFPVELGPTPPAAPAFTLDARAVYTDARKPPAMLVRSRDDVGAAEKLLYRALRKSVDADGVVAFYFMRPLSRAMTRVLVHTPITPNQVTVVAMLCGVAATIVATRGGWWSAVACGLLLWAGATIDCVDGELARLRLQGSKLGEWLDTLADDIATFGALAGVSIGLWRDGASKTWLWAGLAGAAVGFLTQTKLYADLHRMRMPIDTAQYPWFFGKPAGGEARARGVVGTIVYVLAFGFRRDAFVTLLLGLFLAGQRKAAVVVMLGGVAVMLVLLLVHLAVSAARRSEPPRDPSAP